MILAALLYIRKVTATTTVARVTEDYVEEGSAHSLQINELPDGVAMFRIHGPFLFGATDKLSILEEVMDSLPKVVMLRLRNMTAIDATGLHALERLADNLKKSGRHLVVCGMRDQPAKLMNQAEFHRHLGDTNIVATLKEGIARAKELLSQETPAA
ncbi:MAG: sodium-independent anion transporter [Fimbriimonadaceae bacterium]